MDGELIIHKDSVKSRFIEYMSHGVNEMIKINRDNLEDFIRKEIDIEKAKDVIAKYNISNPNARVSPETFFTLSLVDELPLNVDFRFAPEFRMDSVIFKCVNSTSNRIYEKIIPYRKEISDLLMHQMSPNLEVESNKSEHHLNRIENRIENFENKFREAAKSFHEKLHSEIRSVRVSSIENLFLKFSANCFIQKGNEIRKRARITSLKQSSDMSEFSSKVIQFIDKYEMKYNNIDSVDLMSDFLLKTMFPNLSDKKVDTIVDIIKNVKESIDFYDIFKIINIDHTLSLEIISSMKMYEYIKNVLANNKGNYDKITTKINKCKFLFNTIRKQYLFDKEEHNEIKKTIKFYTRTNASKIIHEKKLNKLRVRNEILLKKIEQFLIESNKYEDELKALKNYRRRFKLKFKGYTEVTIHYKKDENLSIGNLSACIHLSKLMKLKGEVSINTHNFYNLVNYIIIIRRDLVKNSDDYIKKNENEETLKFNTSMISIKELYVKCGTFIAVDKLKKIPAYGANDGTPIHELYPLIMMSIDDDNVRKAIKLKGIDVSFNAFANKIKDRIVRKIFSGIKKYIGTQSETKTPPNELIMTKEWEALTHPDSAISKLCTTEKAWSKLLSINPMKEVITGKEVSNISTLSLGNFLEVLFEGQVKEGFFNNVDHILFHQNMVLVMKNGHIHGLTATKWYNEFVLTRTGIESGLIKEEDIDSVQLNRFRGILDIVFKEKTSEFFNKESGSSFIEKLSKSTGVNFIDSYLEKSNIKPTVEHKLSWGSLSQDEQKNFVRFLNIYSFIFPTKISEICLYVDSYKRIKKQIPSNKKEFLFFIENQRDYNTLSIDYRITLDDLMLLGFEDGFYHTILIERAFVIIFNREILSSLSMISEFKKAAGKLIIDTATQHFRLKSKNIGDNQILKRIFVENCMLLIQNEKDKLTGQMINFLTFIFNQKLQIEQGTVIVN